MYCDAVTKRQNMSLALILPEQEAKIHPSYTITLHYPSHADVAQLLMLFEYIQTSLEVKQKTESE